MEFSSSDSTELAEVMVLPSREGQWLEGALGAVSSSESDEVLEVPALDTDDTPAGDSLSRSSTDFDVMASSCPIVSTRSAQLSNTGMSSGRIGDLAPSVASSDKGSPSLQTDRSVSLPDVSVQKQFMADFNFFRACKIWCRFLWLDFANRITREPTVKLYGMDWDWVTHWAGTVEWFLYPLGLSGLRLYPSQTVLKSPSHHEVQLHYAPNFSLNFWYQVEIFKHLSHF